MRNCGRSSPRWAAWAHRGQIAPGGDVGVWLIRAGRGFGKTRAGAEWVSAMARARTARRGSRWSAATLRRRAAGDDRGAERAARGGARDDERCDLARDRGRSALSRRARRRYVYSADAPEALRGPRASCGVVRRAGQVAARRGGVGQSDAGAAAGRAAAGAGDDDAAPDALMRRVMALPGLVETRGRTRDNPHLPASFVAAMVARLWRHAAGAAGAGRRADRGCRGRAVDARR